ncbi:MAG: glycosyltransferase family 2 protein [Treponema sp.]|nr:glycosyltransferase family 2 protein [Treponema sp.]
MISYILYQFIRILMLFILWYVVVMNGAQIVQMVMAFFAVLYRKDDRSGLYPENTIPFTLILPASNSENSAVESIRSMLNLNYLNYEVIAVNDGPAGKTLDSLIDAFDLHKITYPAREQLAAKKVKAVYYNPDFPLLRVIDKENGGIQDALNAGINFSRYPYIVSVNGGSVLDRDILINIAKVFKQYKYTVAVGGAVRAAGNGKILSSLQALEYLQSFLSGRAGRRNFNSLPVIPGGFGAFQKEAVLQAGGFTAEAENGELDLLLKLHRCMRLKKYKYRMVMLPETVFLARPRENAGELYEQRRLWQAGSIDAFSRYRKMLFNPRFGKMGMLVLPYHFFREVATPLLELPGYILIPLAWISGILPAEAAGLFFIAAAGFGIVSSMGSLAIDEYRNARPGRKNEIIKLGFLCIAGNLFYRQMMLFFRLLGIVFYRKRKPAAKTAGFAERR